MVGVGVGGVVVVGVVAGVTGSVAGGVDVVVVGVGGVVDSVAGVCVAVIANFVVCYCCCWCGYSCWCSSSSIDKQLKRQSAYHKIRHTTNN